MSENIYKKYQEGLVKSLIAMPEALVDVLKTVNSNDLSDVNYKLVYQAMIELYSAKQDFSLSNIAVKIDELGGAVDPAWIFDLDTDLVDSITKGSPLAWAKLVKKESIKHQTAEALKSAVVSLDEDGTLDVIEKIKDDLSEISADALGNADLTMKDYIEQFQKETQEIIDEGGTKMGIPSMYPTIDYYTGGWKPSQLITVAARTSVGKTVFAMNSALAAAMAGKSVLFFSLEMNEREFISRLIASMSMVVIKDIEEAREKTDSDAERVREAEALAGTLKLHPDFESEASVEYIKSRALRQAQSADGLDMIIIDYLQLIPVRKNFRGSRQEAVAEISRSMKLLAKEFNVPVMIIAQVNRKNKNNDGDEDQIPTLDDIRESGAIANDSNIIILIHRDVRKHAEEIDPKATFIIEKNRQGAAGKFISVRASLEHNLFIDESQTGKQHLEAMERGDLEDAEALEAMYSNEDFADAPDLNVPEFDSYFSDEDEDIF